MAKMLQWIGGILALLGFGNLIYTPWIASGENSLLNGLLFNGMLFVVPGSIVYGIGVAMAIRARKNQPDPVLLKAVGNGKPVDQRLEELASLRQKGMITPEEFEQYRKEILNAL
ncbi:SHOCT domain-containing protein [Desulfatirhabdium butyrativorans]|uniref:SHOCT domain-containing protein n=1 Tax=Desulfatirhabdium butyrativorans TaxID=340467 RepID=UPI000425D544|nr:SHOCT domain-containing protein [Desulfatirhabdium butyrativorans]